MNLTVGVSTTNVPYSGVSDPPPSTDAHNVTIPDTSDPADPAVRITLSPEAVAAMSQSAGDPVTTLPDVLVQATRRDQQTWINLRSFKPWTPETQRQFDQYVSGTLARANEAFNLVHNAVQIDGLDLNDPNQKEVYEKATDSLMVAAYKALENGNATVDGPGTQDLKARDLISMLRDTKIVFSGSSSGLDGVAADYESVTRTITIFTPDLLTKAAQFGRDVAINSVLFHEVGHAVAAGRADFTQTWSTYSQTMMAQNPGWSRDDLENAWSSSTELMQLEQRTTSRGWGFAELSGRPFDPSINIYGAAPR